MRFAIIGGALGSPARWQWQPGDSHDPDPPIEVGIRILGTPGMATEADSALGVTRVKTLAIGLVTESESAFAVTSLTGGPPPTVVEIGLASEADSTAAAGRLKTAYLNDAGYPSGGTYPGQTYPSQPTVTETDTAQAATGLKAKAAGISSESDSAFAAGKVKARTAGITSESDGAFAVARLAAQVVVIGLVSESDSALAATRVKTVYLYTDGYPGGSSYPGEGYPSQPTLSESDSALSLNALLTPTVRVSATPRYPVAAPLAVARNRAPMISNWARAPLAGRQHDACVEIPQRAALVGHGQIDADLEGT